MCTEIESSEWLWYWQLKILVCESYFIPAMSFRTVFLFFVHVIYNIPFIGSRSSRAILWHSWPFWISVKYISSIHTFLESKYKNTMYASQWIELGNNALWI